MHIGIGYDAHPLAEGRDLILGGVRVPYKKGLSGWSDADALTHAVMDALLGAAGLGDIGIHFPAGDSRYKGVSSLVLLEEVRDKIKQAGFRVGNIDATVLAASPGLAGYLGPMRAALSGALGIVPERVNVKAATGNGLGYIGRGEGIAAQAVALLEAV